MSTKILYAYRIKKENFDLMKELQNLRKKYFEIFNNEKENNKKIICLTINYFLISYKKFFCWIPEDIRKDIKKCDLKDIDIYFYERILLFINSFQIKSFFDFNFQVVVFQDGDYYYLKFFPNDKIQSDLVKEFEKKEYVENYEFYDNVDEPENIDGEEWYNREEKWEELTNNKNNYLDGLIFEIVNPILVLENFLNKL